MFTVDEVDAGEQSTSKFRWVRRQTDLREFLQVVPKTRTFDGIRTANPANWKLSALPKNPYGVLDGQIVTVDELERGRGSSDMIRVRMPRL